jgi:hypothetical protein
MKMSHTLPGLVLRPGRSRHHYLYIFTLKLIAVIGLLLLPLDSEAFLILTGLILLNGLYLYQRHLHPDCEHLSEIKIETSGDIWVRFASGRRSQGKISEASLLTPWVILLHIDLSGRKRRMVLPIWNDMLALEELRLLRVLLRLSRHAQTG